MSHSFSNCPLRSSCLLITNHSTQHIVTATDEVLDLLGYSMSELLDKSIHSLDLKFSPKISSIPQCQIRHVDGAMLSFQVCVHQDPLGSSSCLDYWLIRLLEDADNNNNNASTTSASVIRLSPYGTIEQVQPSPILKQSVQELVGRPVMAFVYQDDVEPLCARLSKICSTSNSDYYQSAIDPFCIRWSSLPCLLSTTPLDHNESLNYDWMSLTLMANQIHSNAYVRPICIMQPLQISDTCEQAMVLHASLFNQLVEYFKLIYGNTMKLMEESAAHSKTYLYEFYYHVVCHIMELLSSLLQNSQTASIQQEEASHDGLWNFLKSNYFTTILELTGLSDHIKSLKTQ